MNSTANDYVKQGQDFVDKTADQAQSMSKRGVAAARDTAQQALDAASDATDSLIEYTKNNPGKALLIAAASGALLITLLKVLTPSRD